MSALICGSLAFDNIFKLGARFADSILPDQIAKLNVSFFLPDLRREFGGCAGNIAYALKQLGGQPLPMATLGQDSADYLKRFESMGIETQYVRTVAEHFTAQANIITDTNNNQITGFHPGAMMMAHLNVIPVSAKADGVQIGIVSPDGRDAMLQHAAQFAAAGVPFIFDPGQGLPMFGGDELLAFIQQATWVTVNDYEAELLQARTGKTLAELSMHVQGLVVTLGEHGADVWTQGVAERIAPVKAAAVIDPTGCGDSFRAALLLGLPQGWSLRRCVALGNRVGAIKIAHQGGQNYTLNLPELLQNLPQ